MIWDAYNRLVSLSGSVEERLDTLLSFGDRMGVQRVSLYLSTSWIGDPSPEEFRANNDELMKAVNAFRNRAFAYAYLNADYPEACIDEIERCVVNGPLTGVYFGWGHKASDRALDPIVERAAEADAVIFHHSWYKVGGDPPFPGGGNSESESTPEDVAELASRHPDVPVIAGHGGSDYELGIRAVREQENVLIGTGGFDPTAGFIEMAVDELGADRIVYSSDSAGRSLGSQIAKTKGAAISDDDKEKILGQNLKRLLTPIMEKKGIPVDD